jgi:hypothetical protein
LTFASVGSKTLTWPSETGALLLQPIALAFNWGDPSLSLDARGIRTLVFPVA